MKVRPARPSPAAARPAASPARRGARAALRLGLVLLPGLGGAPALAQQQDCALTMRLHGFLSRAQSRCGFARTGQGMQDAARSCSRRLSAVSGQEYLRAGAEDFDRNERDRGHDRLCTELLQNFPDMLGR